MTDFHRRVNANADSMSFELHTAESDLSNEVATQHRLTGFAEVVSDDFPLAAHRSQFSEAEY